MSRVRQVEQQKQKKQVPQGTKVHSSKKVKKGKS